MQHLLLLFFLEELKVENEQLQRKAATLKFRVDVLEEAKRKDSNDIKNLFGALGRLRRKFELLEAKFVARNDLETFLREN